MMKRIAVAIVLAMLVGCATCKRCHGQTVVDATAVAEFRRVLELAWNHAGDQVAVEVLKACLGVEALPSGKDSVEITKEADGAILDKSKPGSLVARLLYVVGKREIEQSARKSRLSASDLTVYESVANVVGDATEKAEAKRVVDYLNRRAVTAIKR